MQEDTSNQATKSEEASVAFTPARANRRETRRHQAHVPGPRRKPTLDPAVTQWRAEEKTEGGAPATPEVFDEGAVTISSGAVSGADE